MPEPSLLALHTKEEFEREGVSLTIKPDGDVGEETSTKKPRETTVEKLFARSADRIFTKYCIPLFKVNPVAEKLKLLSRLVHPLISTAPDIVPKEYSYLAKSEEFEPVKETGGELEVELKKVEKDKFEMGFGGVVSTTQDLVITDE